MDDPKTKKIPKPKVRYRKFIPIAHRILAITTGLIIIIGIIESITFFKLNIKDSLILTIILLLFYAILLFFLLQTKTVRVTQRRRADKPAIQTVSQQIANEIDKATEIKITKPKTTAVKKKRKYVRRKKTKRKSSK